MSQTSSDPHSSFFSELYNFRFILYQQIDMKYKLFWLNDYNKWQQTLMITLRLNQLLKSLLFFIDLLWTSFYYRKIKIRWQFMFIYLPYNFKCKDDESRWQWIFLFSTRRSFTIIWTKTQRKYLVDAGSFTHYKFFLCQCSWGIRKAIFL